MSSVSTGSCSSLSSTSGSSLITEKGSSIADKSRGGHNKKSGGASGSSSTSKIPAKNTYVASHRTAAKSSTLGKEREPGGAKKSLTRAGGRAVAASLKSATASHTDRPRTPVRRTTAVGPQAKKEKTLSHAKPAVTTAASSSSPVTTQGKVRGIRTATSAKVKPLKIPPALKRYIIGLLV